VTKLLPRKDVVIVGLGWTGAILAHELAQAGLNVVAIERGPWRDTATDFNIGYMPDELRYAIRRELFLQPAQEAITMRNDASQTALPMRDYGSFFPGVGVGGAGVHWNGLTWRFHEADFVIKSHLTERYGAGRIKDLAIQDWGIRYDELEPSYDKFEYLCGISGKAGNLKGQIQPGGNPFEAPRAREYPNPPLKMPHAAVLFGEAASRMGYHPFAAPAANLSRSYVNPLGIAMGECTYCGYCERFGCANYSKASAQTTILPVLVKMPNFEARTECEVLKVNLRPDGKTAKSVTYIDKSGTELEQPGDIVILCSYGLMNVRMMLLSGIGRPYDSNSNQGVVGRNYCYQTFGAGARLFFDDKKFNPFMSSGAVGQVMDDFQGDAFDHAAVDFVGGASINVGGSGGGRPIGYRPTPPETPRWGAQWKKATAENYNSTMSVGSQGSSYAVQGNYLDLDPTYTDRYGRPLLRMTFDFPDNDIRMAGFIANRIEKIAATMGARQVSMSRVKKSWDSVPSQTTHNTGGAVMGSDPSRSAINRYLQSWDVSNVFVMGASAFPQNTGMNPTGTVGALAFWAADAIKNRYIHNPGPLVPT
jgi:gluconate 2-dehydrogenase alpha chain